MKSFKSYLTEGRPSQRHPLEGHEYHKKTDAQLEYIAKDAHKAAEAMKSHNTTAENKYRDQANDSATVRYWRKKNGMPDWYKKKYDHMKEEVEQIEEGETIVTPKKMIGEPTPGSYAYERKYGKYTAKGTLRKRPNPNKPPVATEPVKEEVEQVDEDWQKVNKADRTDGLSQKAVDAYRRENPGSKLKTAVTEKNPKGKRAARRKSFCSRMGGMKKRLTNPENARDPDSPINKALRRWNC
ncbi:MAG: hypothetical protein EBR30_03960 [Cytophagia bacterium]|nr:hypothetical protein [Cytophagia bacterium]NBW34169.1 hypothetical protein [Cytophagia bacterium]